MALILATLEEWNLADHLDSDVDEAVDQERTSENEWVNPLLVSSHKLFKREKLLCVAE
jgi:hypothetical protein